MESNKIEVRALYRDVLKLVSKSIPRKLEREAKLEVHSIIKLYKIPFSYRSSDLSSERHKMRQTLTK